MDNNIEKLVNKFNISGHVIDIQCCNIGNINNTFIVSVYDNGSIKKYILQKINTNVFKEPYLLMQNIENVTNYCKEYLKNNNEDAERGTLSVIKTKDNNNVYRTENNEFYRMYNYLTNTKTYNNPESLSMFYNCGKAFGKFVRILDGYPMEGLYETIPNFHNTKSRYNDFIYSVKKDPCNRVKEVLEEIKFINERKDKFGIIVDKIKEGEIPLRVTHNDTKINNVLIDVVTDEAVCVIDLDTVMPGSALYDFGDAIRFGAAFTVEDDTDFEKVGINLDYFEEFTKAYLSETSQILTDGEIENLAFSCILLTLELAMRFLTDYINGDTYFKCNYKKHNLDRCRNQISLVKDMENKYTSMYDIIKNIAIKSKVNDSKKIVLKKKTNKN